MPWPPTYLQSATEEPAAPTVTAKPLTVHDGEDVLGQIMADFDAEASGNKQPPPALPFSTKALAYFKMIEDEAASMADLAVNYEGGYPDDDAMRASYLQSSQNMLKGLEAEKKAAMTKPRWRPATDLRHFCRFTGELVR